MNRMIANTDLLSIQRKDILFSQCIHCHQMKSWDRRSPNLLLGNPKRLLCQQISLPCGYLLGWAVQIELVRQWHHENWMGTTFVLCEISMANWPKIQDYVFQKHAIDKPCCYLIWLQGYMDWVERPSQWQAKKKKKLAQWINKNHEAYLHRRNQEDHLPSSWLLS